jgi:hypothetical protein
MRVRRWQLLTGLAGLAIVAGGSVALYARQQAAGSVEPGRFYILNRQPAEAVPVTLMNTDPKFPALSVAVASAPDVELTERTLQRLVPSRQIWEYSVIPVPDTDPTSRLNAAGRDGWELVSVLTTPKSSSFLLKRLGR